MTPQELKNSILQRAIQGKLVEQRPEEGTGEELYKQIQAEKARLIKEGKLKKEKPLPPISEDEIPFEIPKSWKWIKWGTVINVVSARRVHQADWRSNGVPFYRAREIAVLADTGKVDNELFISQSLYEEFAKSGVPKAGDLMVTAVGTLGKVYVVKPGDFFYYKDASVICFENYGKLDSQYLKLVMQSEVMRSQIRSNSDGTTVATLTMVRMNEYILPLPPLVEQKRIVAKIEELLPLVERYEKAYNRLEQLNRQFPDDMKKSILQLAIQGKLVEQRPEEGTGEELYKQIQAEKAKLIKEGKLKKGKTLPSISEDEIPFDIPVNWKWVRLNDLSRVITKGTTPRGGNVAYMDSGIGFLRAENVSGYNSLDLTGLKYIDEETHFCFLNRSIICADDILITIAGTLGRTGLVREENLPLNANQAVSIVRMVETKRICLEYLVYAINAPLIQKDMLFQRKITAIPNLTLEIISMTLIPLPPLAEQKRIVAKIEELLPLCDLLNKKWA